MHGPGCIFIEVPEIITWTWTIVNWHDSDLALHSWAEKHPYNLSGSRYCRLSSCVLTAAGMGIELFRMSMAHEAAWQSGHVVVSCLSSQGCMGENSLLLLSLVPHAPVFPSMHQGPNWHREKRPTVQGPPHHPRLPVQRRLTFPEQLLTIKKTFYPIF